MSRILFNIQKSHNHEGYSGSFSFIPPPGPHPSNHEVTRDRGRPILTITTERIRTSANRLPRESQRIEPGIDGLAGTNLQLSCKVVRKRGWRPPVPARPGDTLWPPHVRTGRAT